MHFLLRPVAAVLNAVSSPLRPGPPSRADASPHRAPAAAPKRQPKPTPATATAAPSATGMQTLLCEPGQHQWTRPAVPGRKPKACPAHT